MSQSCHRCHGALTEDAPYCPHCAAPQLRVSPPDEVTDAPPAGLPATHRDRRTVDWRRVFRLALLIALPLGILTIPPLFFPLTIAAPVLVITLYRRQRPGAVLDRRSGFRIGALTGVLTAYISAFLLAALRLLERYPLHQGSVLDRDYAQYIQQVTAAAQNSAQGNDASMALLRTWLEFFNTPDGKAGWTLFGTASTALTTVLLASLGGMLGAHLSRRRTANS